MAFGSIALLPGCELHGGKNTHLGIVRHRFLSLILLCEHDENLN